MSRRPSDPIGGDDTSHRAQGARPGFQVLTSDVWHALDDLDAFDALLAGKAELDEHADILPFFAAHPHLALCFGFYNPLMARYDRVAYELPLFGLFRPDVVVGDWQRKSYCFVELEDAKSCVSPMTNWRVTFGIDSWWPGRPDGPNSANDGRTHLSWQAH